MTMTFNLWLKVTVKTFTQRLTMDDVLIARLGHTGEKIESDGRTNQMKLKSHILFKQTTTLYLSGQILFEICGVI